MPLAGADADDSLGPKWASVDCGAFADRPPGNPRRARGVVALLDRPRGGSWLHPYVWELRRDRLQSCAGRWYRVAGAVARAIARAAQRVPAPPGCRHVMVWSSQPSFRPKTTIVPRDT